jgi:L,D-peptidoglycan transpeptidase YkuD (ErfK/YbiS/YcfS/YnhG family)
MAKTVMLQEIRVIADDALLHGGWLLAGDARIPCRIGKKGMTASKREGDLCSPTGTFPLRCLFYRPDRLEMPATGLPTLPLSPALGWCDAPEDANYNRLIAHPYSASAEKLWREDAVYDLILVIGHNDNPPIPGAGSAIFMHLMREDGEGTEGCIALKRDDMLALLAQLDSRTRMTIG